MLKIPGLKKKKKGKKKKDQELFTEEELEQYKQEQARKAALAANGNNDHETHATEAVHEATEEKTEESSEQTNDEEWSRFAALTTGIDSVLKKTQDDLDRIKSHSFFQRVAPKPDEPKNTEPQEPEEDEETKKERLMEALKNAVVELSESEAEESDVDDASIFDADYLEKVELPDAFIPESPTFEEPEGDDPFDTGYAEKVIKGPEVSKSGKKIVNIGAAALVLTGAVDNLPKSALVKRPKRRQLKNLLLSSFDAENEDPEEKGEEEKVEEKHNQLDDLFEIEDDAKNVEIDLTVSLHVKYQEKKEEPEPAEDGVDSEVLKEFDALNEEDDEFAQLAAESLHKPAEVIQVIEAIPVLEAKPPESTDWAEFEQTEDVLEIKGIETELETPVDDDDPFNTTFVEAVLPKVDSFEELARESISKPLKEPPPARPAPPRPGPPPPRPPPAEINLMEGNPSISITNDDDITRDELARRKSSLSLSISAKNVQFAVPTPDPLKSDIEFSTLIKKPLTPYYPKEDEADDEEAYVDPFDTSFVPNVQPSQLELNYIEKEMLKNLEDDDFDPRAVTPEPKIPLPAATKPVEPIPETPKAPEDPFGNEIFDDDKYSALAIIDDSHKSVAKPDADQLDILTNTLADAAVDVKVLTPINQADSFEMADIDPFDTTFAENIRPGEAELKLIESELIQ
ncbi:protein stoned-A [Culicoides brevitarsis]|uniref:protein stoned-A n=1 Tax=Culicoides brevitarsis TaxID=469753 RepID=UPI00307CC2F8